MPTLRPNLHRSLLLAVSIGLAGTALLSPGEALAQSPAPSAAAAGSCTPTDVPPDTEITLDVGGAPRTALLHPPTTTDGALRPLVLAFHGYGGGEWDLSTTGGLSTLADARGFVVAYPQGVGDGPTWDLTGDTDTTFVVALIDQLVATQCVDPARVFATGFSMGGGMTNVLACRLAGRFAAVAPVAANHGATWGDPCVPSRPVPIVAFHGTADTFLPYEGGDSPFPDRPVTGVEAWMADWAAANGCTGHPVVASVATDVDSLTWQGCAAPTTLYREQGAGHIWPGGVNDPSFGPSTDSISASDLMWQLFSSVP